MRFVVKKKTHKQKKKQLFVQTKCAGCIAHRVVTYVYQSRRSPFGLKTHTHKNIKGTCEFVPSQIWVVKTAFVLRFKTNLPHWLQCHCSPEKQRNFNQFKWRKTRCYTSWKKNRNKNFNGNSMVLKLQTPPHPLHIYIKTNVDLKSPPFSCRCVLIGCPCAHEGEGGNYEPRLPSTLIYSATLTI